MTTREHQEITAQELVNRLSSREPLVIAEALDRPYFDRGHLPGAINLPLSTLAADVERLVPSKQSEIVVYCTGPTCQNSHIAGRKLTELGYSNVRVFSGGKLAWQEAGQRLEASPGA